MKSKVQTKEKGMNTKEPHNSCSVGKSMPTMKLHTQEETLPRAMAAGRGATSKSSVKI